MKQFGEELSAAEFKDMVDLIDVIDGKINYYDFIKIFSEV
jgi:Ca2+-binding EF-hand superfamily protein